jgi:hypothetical protein
MGCSCPPARLERLPSWSLERQMLLIWRKISTPTSELRPARPPGRRSLSRVSWRQLARGQQRGLLLRLLLRGCLLRRCCCSLASSCSVCTLVADGHSPPELSAAGRRQPQSSNKLLLVFPRGLTVNVSKTVSTKWLLPPCLRAHMIGRVGEWEWGVCAQRPAPSVRPPCAEPAHAPPGRATAAAAAASDARCAAQARGVTCEPWAPPYGPHDVPSTALPCKRAPQPAPAPRAPAPPPARRRCGPAAAAGPCTPPPERGAGASGATNPDVLCVPASCHMPSNTRLVLPL